MFIFLTISFFASKTRNVEATLHRYSATDPREGSHPSALIFHPISPMIIVVWRTDNSCILLVVDSFDLSAGMDAFPLWTPLFSAHWCVGCNRNNWMVSLIFSHGDEVAGLPLAVNPDSCGALVPHEAEMFIFVNIG